MVASIAQLETELVTLITGVTNLSGRSYSVFNVDEVTETASLVGFPLAGVSYEGATPLDPAVNSVNKAYKSGNLTTLHFSITIGIEYKYATTDDSKPIATDLLDEVRRVVLGYTGINNRPWRYTGEIPLDSGLEGVIFYGQMWETDVPVIGNSPN